MGGNTLELTGAPESAACQNPEGRRRSRTPRSMDDEDQPTASVVRPKVEGTRYACPCCRHLTLDERGGYEICPVCFWEDDGQDDLDADRVRGGPNGELSLAQARRNYAAWSACEERFKQHVRPPLLSEKVDGRQ